MGSFFSCYWGISIVDLGFGICDMDLIESKFFNSKSAIQHPKSPDTDAAESEKIRESQNLASFKKDSRI